MCFQHINTKTAFYGHTGLEVFQSGPSERQDCKISVRYETEHPIACQERGLFVSSFYFYP